MPTFSVVLVKLATQLLGKSEMFGVAKEAWRERGVRGCGRGRYGPLNQSWITKGRCTDDACRQGAVRSTAAPCWAEASSATIPRRPLGASSTRCLKQTRAERLGARCRRASTLSRCSCSYQAVPRSCACNLGASRLQRGSSDARQRGGDLEEETRPSLRSACAWTGTDEDEGLVFELAPW